MSKIYLTKEFWILATQRAIRTAAQSMLSLITVGQSIFGIDWLGVLSLTATAVVASYLTSIITGIPETLETGEISVDTNDDTASISTVKDLSEYKTGEKITLTVK